MSAGKQWLERMSKGPTDVIGLDWQNRCLRAVRMRKSGAVFHLVTAASLPEPPENTALTLPPALKAKHALMALPSRDSILRLLPLAPHAGEPSAQQLQEWLGLREPDAYRTGYRILQEASAKGEGRLLALGMPETAVQGALRLFPTGLPAPFSVENTCVCALNAYLYTQTPERSQEAVGVLVVESSTMTLGVAQHGAITFLRHFESGARAVAEGVQQTYGVDLDMAHKMLLDPAFDVSAVVNAMIAPLVRQIFVSRDFVERRDNCRFSRIEVVGDLDGWPTLPRDLERTTGGLTVTAWNPFTTFIRNDNAPAPEVAAEAHAYAAAIGACIGTFTST